MKIKTQLFLILLVLGLISTLTAQQSLRDKTFSNIDQEMADAKQKNADVLAPESFSKAEEFYKKAEEEFRRGKNIDQVRKRLKQVESYLLKSQEAVRIAEVTLEKTIEARNAAISAGAAKFNDDYWKEAEKKFISATEKLEDGDAKGAKSRGGEAESLYRKSELEAIKTNFLTPAWTLLEQADRTKVDKFAPKTLAKARELAKLAEDLLRENRYDNEQALESAQRAKYEAAHAIYLSNQIKRFEDADLEFEDVYLMAEKPLERISHATGIKPHFHEGLDTITTAIVDRFEDKDDRLTKALQIIEERNLEISTLQAQIKSMESRLGNLTAEEQSLRDKLELRRQRDALIEEVSTMFTQNEGNVLRDRDNMIMRLYGLTFDVGKSVIEPRYFPLLSKVQNALRKFPRSTFVVEGHTDSRGSAATNRRLSQERAEAVKQYLIANMGLTESEIQSVGFGETRPLESNETGEGRTKNRRIDIVIIPSWANESVNK